MDPHFRVSVAAVTVFSYFSMIRLGCVNVKKVQLPCFMYSVNVRVIGVRISLWKVVSKLGCRS